MPSDKRSSVGYFGLFFLIINCDKLIVSGNRTENVWRTAGKLTGLLFKDCMQLSFEGPQEQFLIILQRCLKRRSLVALDSSLKADVIKIASGIELVKSKNHPQSDRELAGFKSIKNDSDWRNQLLKKLAHVLNTHVLKIRLNNYEHFITEGRGRKKHNMMMSLLMFAIAAVGLIIVPMGFQFLAVLGGKALLLAKLALILTAIQGLKKIATSNLNYGLYATPEHHHNHGLCKDGICRKNYKALEDDDSVYVAVDVDHLSEANNVDFDEFWHYDRKWPYEAESHDAALPHSHYQPQEQYGDLFHPLQPRVDALKSLM